MISLNVLSITLSTLWLNPLQLVRLELKFLFGYTRRTDSREILVFIGNFSHRHCRISLDAFFSELAVPSGVDCVLSAASRTVIGVVELLKPFDGRPHI